MGLFHIHNYLIPALALSDSEEEGKTAGTEWGFAGFYLCVKDSSRH